MPHAPLQAFRGERRAQLAPPRRRAVRGSRSRRVPPRQTLRDGVQQRHGLRRLPRLVSREPPRELVRERGEELLRHRLRVDGELENHRKQSPVRAVERRRLARVVPALGRRPTRVPPHHQQRRGVQKLRGRHLRRAVRRRQRERRRAGQRRVERHRQFRGAAPRPAPDRHLHADAAVRVPNRRVVQTRTAVARGDRCRRFPRVRHPRPSSPSSRPAHEGVRGASHRADEPRDAGVEAAVAGVEAFARRLKIRRAPALRRALRRAVPRARRARRARIDAARRVGLELAPVFLRRAVDVRAQRRDDRRKRRVRLTPVVDSAAAREPRLEGVQRRLGQRRVVKPETKGVAQRRRELARGQEPLGRGEREAERGRAELLGQPRAAAGDVPKKRATRRRRLPRVRVAATRRGEHPGVLPGRERDARDLVESGHQRVRARERREVLDERREPPGDERARRRRERRARQIHQAQKRPSVPRVRRRDALAELQSQSARRRVRVRVAIHRTRLLLRRPIPGTAAQRHHLQVQRLTQL